MFANYGSGEKHGSSAGSLPPFSGEIKKFAGKPGTTLEASNGAAYRIERLLGQGGFAEVFLVKEIQTGLFFALKMLRMWEIQPQERKEVFNRFKREFECSKIDSPYLIHSYQQGYHLGNPFFTMDYCPNGSLRQRIGKKMSSDEVRHIATATLKGLSALHQEGIIHRDLKPENILFTKQETPLLTDFGISGFLKSRMTVRNWLGQVKAVTGTLVYMPPEQLDATKAYTSMGPVTDIFAYGVLVFEMLTGGHFPFGEYSEENEEAYLEKVRKGNWTNLEKMAAQLPEPWPEIIQGCIHPNMARRYQQTDEILTLLGAKIPQSRTLTNPATATLQTPKVLLRVMNGDQHDKVYDLSALQDQKKSHVFTLGWFDMNNPNINDLEVVEEFTSYISRFHATIEYSPSQLQWFIRDGQWLKKNGKFDWHESTNGLLLNSGKVSIYGSPLNHGDIITVGDTTLRFEIHSPVEAATTE